jgi:membrane associated rhomboid family serine protease
MSGFQINRRFFESPHPAAYFLLCANIVVYGLCVSQSGLGTIPGIANAALFLFLALGLVPAACSRTFSPGIAQMREVLIKACAHVDATLVGVAIMALVLTLLLYSQELYRGIKDIGFVGASLSGERRRRQGI